MSGVGEVLDEVLDEVLGAAPAPGVHHGVAAPDVAQARLRVERAGRPCVVLPEVLDVAGLHRALASGLGLPSWYGHNLDALADVLPHVDPGTVVLWPGWEAFAGAHPRTFAVVVDLLGHAVALLLLDAPMGPPAAPA